MIRPSFESFSRNAEDVVLWRALHNVERGRYVDVGAGHPSRGSVSMAFYLHGWSGIAVEPDPRHIPLLTEQRPRDIVIGSAITAKDGDVATLHVFEGADRATLDPDVALVRARSGLEGRRIEVPTRRLDQVLDGAGWQGLDLHFLAVDAEGSERDVLSSIDLETWRPWVLVVRALQPDRTASNRDSWENIVLEAGYRLCLFDGVCCFYVSEERGGQLAGFLDHGACALDDYITPATRQAAEAAGSLPALEEDLGRWRTEVIGRWARVMAEKDELARLRLALGELRTRYQTLAREHHELSQESHSLYLQMRELRRSASWRITQPLRSAGGLLQPRWSAPVTRTRASYESGLADRLRKAGTVLLDGDLPEATGDPRGDAIALLDLMIDVVRQRPTRPQVWLLSAAVWAELPTSDRVLEGVRMFSLGRPLEIVMWLLDQAVAAEAPGVAASTIELVTERVLVEVDRTMLAWGHSAGPDHLVRETVPRWMQEHDVLPVAWTACWESLRILSDDDCRRMATFPEADRPAQEAPAQPRLVIPWQTVVVLTERPPAPASARLAALAEHSGNSVVAIGYDCIPFLSADVVRPGETAPFARYLTILKHSRRVAAITDSAAAEFRGFTQALAAQGVPGPEVAICRLPASPVDWPGVIRRAESTARDSYLPLVVAVVGFERRENSLGLVYAAERLWREGLHFELRFVSDHLPDGELDKRVEGLRDTGRAIGIDQVKSGAEAVALLRAARFSVSPYFEEGYGLPIALSLALGTPVLSGFHGGTRDTRAVPGALLVDSGDDEAIVDGMRILLTDDAALRALVDGVKLRPRRSWDDFASELWDLLVRPALAESSAV